MKRPSPFFIFGLPRSRTAWLSVFFTVGRVVCWHDLTARNLSTGEIVGKMLATDADFVGVADPALTLMSEELVGLFPEAPVAIIRRDPTLSAMSLARVSELQFAKCDNAVKAFDRALDRFEDNVPCSLSIRCEEIEQNITRLWTHLVPGEPFPEDHFERMKWLNIQVKPELMKRAAKGGA